MSAIFLAIDKAVVSVAKAIQVAQVTHSLSAGQFILQTVGRGPPWYVSCPAMLPPQTDQKYSGRGSELYVYS